MESLSFNHTQMAAILKMANAMASADGHLDGSELLLMSQEAFRFDIPPYLLEDLLEQSGSMEFTDALSIITVMKDAQKRYVTAYLGTMMAVDKEIDKKEMELWKFVSTICNLPTMNIQEALEYMDDNSEILIEDNMKSNFLQSILCGNNNPRKGKFVFHSNVHQRYEDGIAVRGEQIGCNREIVIEKNISGDIGYSITINNLDVESGSWGANPMGTKPMKVISMSDNEVELLGFGYDKKAVAMGFPMSVASFEDYGMTLHHDGQNVTHCVLHMIERNVDIDYYNK